MREYTQPVPIVSSAEDEKSLARSAEKHHVSAKQKMIRGVMEGLDEFRKSGIALLKLKKAHRKEWHTWFKANRKRLGFSFNYKQASSYMRIARHWDEVKKAKSIIEALRWLRAKKKATKKIEGEGNSESSSANSKPKAEPSQDVLASFDWSWTREMRSKPYQDKVDFMDKLWAMMAKKLGLKINKGT